MLGVLGLSFLTHAWILFSSEYFQYKIFIHESDKFQENLSRPGIFDAEARYQAEAQGLRNTTLMHVKVTDPL